MNNCTKFAALWMKFSNITSPPTGPQAANPPLWKNTHFNKPKKMPFFEKKIIFNFLSLVGTPMNDVQLQTPARSHVVLVSERHS